MIAKEEWRGSVSRLENMFIEAGYDEDSLEAGLTFFRENIAPRLGFEPLAAAAVAESNSLWKSCMNDDASPIEYSWTWEEKPKVRYSVELIGPDAGSTLDPFNQVATLETVQDLKMQQPHMDWTLFEHLLPVLEAEQVAYKQQATSQSQPQSRLAQTPAMFLAFQTWNGRTDAKAYLVPPDALNRDTFSITRSFIYALETLGLNSDAYDSLLQFLASCNPATSTTFKPLSVSCQCLAIDCVAPSRSRLKFYLRSTSTSFDTVRQILRLNGTIASPWTDQLLIQLRQLWCSVLSLPLEFSDHDELPVSEHETSGILFYFDIHPKYAVPVPKVYIPVKHYGKSDLTVLRSLEKYLETSEQSQMMPNFCRVVDNMSDYRNLGESRGVQTYISCAAKEGTLSLTSYLSPELHRSFEELREEQA